MSDWGNNRIQVFDLPSRSKEAEDYATMSLAQLKRAARLSSGISAGCVPRARTVRGAQAPGEFRRHSHRRRFAPLVVDWLFFAARPFRPRARFSRSPRSYESPFFKTIRAHLAAKLPPTLGTAAPAANPTLVLTPTLTLVSSPPQTPFRDPASVIPQLKHR